MVHNFYIIFRCSKRNYYSTLDVSFKDPVLGNNCSDSRAHCVQLPSEPDFQFTKCVDSPDPLGVQFSDGTNYFSKSCRSKFNSIHFLDVNFAWPLEIFDTTAGKKRQILVVSTQKGLIVNDMETETVLFKSLTEKGNFEQMAVTGGSFRERAYVIGTNNTSIYSWSLTFNNGVFTATLVAEGRLSGRITDLTAFYDTTGARHVAAVYIETLKRVEFHNVDVNFGTPMQSWTLTLAPTTTRVNIKHVIHQQNNLAAAGNAGCFPAVEGTQRTLIVIYTNNNIYIFGFRIGQLGNVNLNLEPLQQFGKTLYYQSPLNVEISAVEAFSDCFGSTTGQGIYLAVGLYDQNLQSTLQVVSLEEFSLVVFNPICYNDPNWWMRPSSQRQVTNGACVNAEKQCQSVAFYPSTQTNDDWNCRQRATIAPRLLSGRATEIASALSTHKSDQFTAQDLEFSYMNYIFAVSANHVNIFTVQEIACASNTAPIITEMNRVTFSHNVFNLVVSHNAQHMFSALERRDWEIVGWYRLIEICNILQRNPSESTLQIYKERCESQSPTNLGIYDFITYHSQCNGGWYCPLFGSVNQRTRENRVENIIQSGQHVIRPTAIYPCDKGFFCPGTYDALRKSCPRGFKCPNQSMKYPQQCSVGSNFEQGCLNEGSLTETSCPPGVICKTADVGTPSPPGYFVGNEANRRVLTKCGEGRFCPLMNNATVAVGNFTLCPAGYFCPDSTSVPTKCTVTYGVNNTQVGNTTQYCPTGSTFGWQCPSGFECSSTTNLKKCEKGYYCPNGTQTAQLCPAGFYCPFPDEIYLCPLGSYCVAGSFEPMTCQLMVICPNGSKTKTLAIYVVLVDAILIVIALIAVQILISLCSRIKKRRRKKKLEIMGGLQESQQITGPILPKLAFKQRSTIVDYEFNELQLVKKKNKEILIDGTKGKISHGKVTGIMGATREESRALLDVLTGNDYYGWVHGQLKVNGSTTKSMSTYSQLISFIPQRDVLYSQFKIREEVLFSAQTRIKTSLNPKALNEKVNQVLEFLDIKWMANKPCGDVDDPLGFSPAQYKKISIACELVTDPTVLALENPFVGDLKDQMELMGIFKKLADSGTTVIVLLDKPRWEVFSSLDDVIVMGKGGQTVFNGPALGCIQYFNEIGFKCPKSVNPADLVFDVLKGNVERPGDDDFSEDKLPYLWQIKQQESSKPWSIGTTESLIEDAPEKPRKLKKNGAGCCTQYFFLIWITSLQLLRHIKGILFEIVFTVLVSSLIGGLFFNMEWIEPLSSTLQSQCPLFIDCSLPVVDNISLISIISILGLAVVAIQSSEKIFGVDKEIYERHVERGGNKLAYFLAKLTSHFPSTIILPSIYMVIWYLFATPRQNFFVWYGIFILIYYCFSGFGYMMTTLLPREHGVFFAFGFSLLSGIISGFEPSLAVLNNSWITQAIVVFSPARWALELMYVSEVSFYRNRGANVLTGLAKRGFDSNFLKVALLNVFMLILYGTLFRIFTFLILYFSDPKISTWFKYLYRSIWRKTKKLKKTTKKKKGGLSLQESLNEYEKAKVVDDEDEVVLNE